MLTFLFWNLKKLDLIESIVRLVNLYQVDIVILAESISSPGTILSALQVFHFLGDDDCPKIQIYTRYPNLMLPIQQSKSRYTVRSLVLSNGEEALLIGAHLISLTNTQSSTLDEEIKLFAREIREIELERGHRRTLLVGDLNLNPFADGIVSASGLNGVMTKQIALQYERTVRSNPYPYFYNPMWSRFGDHPERPPGTFYRSSGGDHICYFWNIFDQVLIRPHLLDRWNDSQLEIPVSDGVVNFLSDRMGLPRGNGLSDHLPLIFRLRY